ncbi:MAG: MalY/PatB family protein [Nocardioidaceae bacterium]
MTNPLETLSLDQLRRRTSEKWRAFPSDVLPLWVAEMDVPLAPAVVEALREAVDLGDSGYSTGQLYAEAVADFAAARWQWSVDVDSCTIVPDVMLGIVELLKLTTGPGDPVIVNPPVYPPFFPFVEHMDRRVVEVPLTVAHRLDLEQLAAAFERETASGARAAYLLCSPHNPTGTVHSRDELLAVAELASRYGVRVVVDEIHSPLVYADSGHHPYLSLAGTEDAFSVLSASKAFNLSGLKAALAIAGPAAAADLARIPEEVSHGPSHLGVIAHAAGLTCDREWLDDLLAGLDSNRSLLAEHLSELLPQVSYRPPQGTYLAWLDCRGLDLGGVDPAEAFLTRGKVALNSGLAFGAGGEGHVRLNLATSSAILTEAVERMARASRP